MNIYIKLYSLTLIIIFLKFATWSIKDFVDCKIDIGKLSKELISELIASVILSIIPILSALFMIFIIRKKDFPIYDRG